MPFSLFIYVATIRRSLGIHNRAALLLSAVEVVQLTSRRDLCGRLVFTDRSTRRDAVHPASRASSDPPVHLQNENRSRARFERSRAASAGGSRFAAVTQVAAAIAHRLSASTRQLSPQNTTRVFF